MIIFLRHGQDYSNDSATYIYDAKLKEEGKSQVRHTFSKLIKKYGVPHKVYCSPFRRTVETSLMLHKIHEDIPIKVCKRIGRYFTRKEKKNPDISPQTKKADPVIDKPWEKYTAGITKFCKKIKKYASSHAIKNGEDRVIWVISHTVPLKRCAEFFHVSVPDHFKFLEHFVA